MTCERTKLPGGGVAIMCSRGRKRRDCRFCGRTATLLCDYALTGKRAGNTCDAAMCASCAARQPVASPHAGDTVDYCPPHARMVTSES